MHSWYFCLTFHVWGGRKGPRVAPDSCTMVCPLIAAVLGQRQKRRIESSSWKCEAFCFHLRTSDLWNTPRCQPVGPNTEEKPWVRPTGLSRTEGREQNARKSAWRVGVQPSRENENSIWGNGAPGRFTWGLCLMRKPFAEWKREEERRVTSDSWLWLISFSHFEPPFVKMSVTHFLLREAVVWCGQSR